MALAYITCLSTPTNCYTVYYAGILSTCSLGHPFAGQRASMVGQQENLKPSPGAKPFSQCRRALRMRPSGCAQLTQATAPLASSRQSLGRRACLRNLPGGHNNKGPVSDGYHHKLVVVYRRATIVPRRLHIGVKLTVTGCMHRRRDKAGDHLM